MIHLNYHYIISFSDKFVLKIYKDIKKKEKKDSYLDDCNTLVYNHLFNGLFITLSFLLFYCYY